MMTGDPDSCEKMCLDAIKVSREYLCDYTWDAKAYNRLATVAEKRGDLEQAVKHLEFSLQEISDSKVRSRLKKIKVALQKKKSSGLDQPRRSFGIQSKR